MGMPLLKKSARFGVPGARPTRWVTRERPKIDRIACPWLVRRFVDPRAEFLYVPASAVLSAAESEGAIAYDISGAPLEHDGDSCSFDAFLKAFDLHDPALDDLAVIVRGADTGRPRTRPAGAWTIGYFAGAVAHFSGRSPNARTRTGGLRRALRLVPSRARPKLRLGPAHDDGVAMKTPTQSSAGTPPRPVTFAEAFWFWLKLGFISFGGPAGQIAIMHQELVEKRRWISENRFLHGLNYCMVLPGPEAQQLATYIGWLMHGTWGGIVAGGLFVLPSLFILIALSWTYMAYGAHPTAAGILYGIKPAVTAIVLFAAWRIASRALKNWLLWAIAALAFIAIFVFHAPFPAIVLGAGLIGCGRRRDPPGVLYARAADTRRAPWRRDRRSSTMARPHRGMRCSPGRAC